jgi:hypothetical protein
LRTGLAGLTLRALRSNFALWTLRAGLTGLTLRALRTLRAGCTLRTLWSRRSLWTLWAFDVPAHAHLVGFTQFGRAHEVYSGVGADAGVNHGTRLRGRGRRQSDEQNTQTRCDDARDSRRHDDPLKGGHIGCDAPEMCQQKNGGIYSLKSEVCLLIDRPLRFRHPRAAAFPPAGFAPSTPPADRSRAPRTCLRPSADR